MLKETVLFLFWAFVFTVALFGVAVILDRYETARPVIFSDIATERDRAT